MAVELRLEAANLINAGGGVVFLVAGLAILALGRGSRRGRLVGAFAVLWGLSHAFQNVVGYGEPERAVHLVLEMAAFVALAIAIAHAAAPLTGAPRRKFVAIVAATGIGVAFFAYGTVQRLVDNRPFDQWSNFATVALVPGALVVLLAACALRPAATPSEGRAWLLLGLSTGIYAAFFTAASASLPTLVTTHGVLALNISGLVLGAVLSVVLYWVLTCRQPPDQRAARWTFLVLLVTSLAACVMVLTIQPFDSHGGYGVARIIGAVILLIAVVKYDLLGVPLARIAVRRSVAAGFALATLFVVAQIMQNFLSAEYGLLTGGIVAGIFLFVANPIQRAIEKRAQGDRPRPGGNGKEKAYRNALRLAMRDRVLSPKERIDLAHLADELGLTARRAAEIEAELQS